MRSVIFSLALLAVACALPQPEREKQEFIPESELRVVSLVREGLSYYARSRLVDAEFKLRQALVLAPDTHNISVNLAVVLTETGQYGEALRIYEGLLKDEPYALDLLSGRAQVYFAKGDFVRAARAFNEALAIALDSVEKFDPLRAARIARSLSVLAFKIGDEDGASCYAQLAYSLNNDVEELLRFGKLLVALAEYERAVTLLTAYIDATKLKNNAKLFTELALAHFGLEKFKESHEFSALALDVSGIAGADAELKLIDALSSQELDRSEENASTEAKPKKSKRKNKKAKAATTDDSEDSEDPDEQERIQQEQEAFEALIRSHPHESVQALYWPVPFLERLLALSEALGPEE